MLEGIENVTIVFNEVSWALEEFVMVCEGIF